MTNIGSTTTHIICDLSDVLIKGLEGVENILASKTNTPANIIAKELFSYEYTPLWLGHITEIKFFEQMIAYYQWPISVSQMILCIRDNFHPIDGVWDIYQNLAENYKIILASVNAREWVSYLENKYSYRDLFANCVYYSFDVGYTKKQMGFYWHILDSHQISAHQVFMIDDSTNNLNTAKAVGIKGVKFLSYSQLSLSLRNFGFLE